MAELITWLKAKPLRSIYSDPSGTIHVCEPVAYMQPFRSGDGSVKVYPAWRSDGTLCETAEQVERAIGSGYL